MVSVLLCYFLLITLQWRHNDHDSVSIHQPHGCLLNRLFRRRSKKTSKFHDDVIKWKKFPRYWPFVRGIHRSPVNSPHKGQWRGALMFTLSCARINGWVNNREAGDLRRYRTHYDVIVMFRVTGLCVGNSPGPVNSPHKGPVTREMFPFDDVIMTIITSPKWREMSLTPGLLSNFLLASARSWAWWGVVDKLMLPKITHEWGLS